MSIGRKQLARLVFWVGICWVFAQIAALMFTGELTEVLVEADIVDTPWYDILGVGPAIVGAVLLAGGFFASVRYGIAAVVLLLFQGFVMALWSLTWSCNLDFACL